MIAVNSIVKLNMPLIRKLEDDAVKALEMTAEQLHTDVVQAQVIPFDTGSLQNESTFVDTKHSAQGKVSLVSSTPYARRMYFHPEYNFNTAENPNARGRWYEPWISGEKKDYCQKVFKKIYKEVSGL